MFNSVFCLVFQSDLRIRTTIAQVVLFFMQNLCYTTPLTFISILHIFLLSFQHRINCFIRILSRPSTYVSSYLSTLLLFLHFHRTHLSNPSLCFQSLIQ